MIIPHHDESRKRKKKNLTKKLSILNAYINFRPTKVSNSRAIGTGVTATSMQAQEMCKYIREEIRKLYNNAVAENIRIQYGGSVKPSNANEILNMEDIDGALVGGASLTDDFVAIVNY